MIKTFKVLAYGILLSALHLSPVALFAQKESLFTEAGITYRDLNPVQQMNYNILQSNPLAASIHLVKLNDLDRVQYKGRIKIDLPFLPCPEMMLHAQDVAFNGNNDYDWYGEKLQSSATDMVCGDASLTLVNHEQMGGLQGLLKLDGYDIEIRDLTGGIQAFVVLDRQQLNEATCGNKPTDDQSGIGGGGATVLGPDCFKKVLNVLIVYSPASEEHVTKRANGDPLLYTDAYLSVYEMNISLQHSGISKRITLAGVERWTEHVEEEEPRLEYKALVENSFINSKRNQYRADIVVEMLETDFNGAGFPGSITGGRLYGDSRQIGSYNDQTNQIDRNYAYALVNAKHNHANYAFAHEVGHLLGGRHENDTDVKPFLDPNAHGFRYNAGLKRYRTVVSTRGLITTTNLVNYFSSPHIYRDQQPMGTNGQNNAYRINQHYDAVASFYTDGTVGFLNNITAQKIPIPQLPGGITAPCAYYYKLTAGVNHCTVFNTFTHQWQISYDGITWINYGTANTLDLYSSDNGNILVRLTSTASGFGTGTIASITNSYPFVNCAANGNSPYSAKKAAGNHEKDNAFSIYPNPNNGNFRLKYQLEHDAEARITLLDLSGRVIEELYSGTLYQYAPAIDIHTKQALKTGLYIVVIQTDAVTQQLKLSVN